MFKKFHKDFLNILQKIEVFYFLKTLYLLIFSSKLAYFRSVQKGMDGEAEMEVGHHVGNRAHVIEKKRDKDGRVRQQQRFVNLDEGL